MKIVFFPADGKFEHHFWNSFFFVPWNWILKEMQLHSNLFGQRGVEMIDPLCSKSFPQNFGLNSKLSFGTLSENFRSRFFFWFLNLNFCNMVTFEIIPSAKELYLFRSVINDKIAITRAFFGRSWKIRWLSKNQITELRDFSSIRAVIYKLVGGS